MLIRACLSLALLAAPLAWSQVVPTATGGNPADNTQMQTPPPVSGESYPTLTGAEARSNYLDPGLTVETSYNDNLLPGYAANPISTMGYSVSPSMGFDKVTPRLHQTWTYDANFTLYQDAAARNATDQHASLDLHYLLSPHLAISGRDTFEKGSNLFNQPSLGGPVSGSASSSLTNDFAPFLDRLGNQANGGITYQFGAHGMIGASGTTRLLHFPNQPQSGGLADSDSLGGSAFYNRQLSGAQYVGATYQYSNEADSADNTQTTTQMSTVYLFYSIYLAHALTVSISGGPQHYDVAQSALPPSAAWTPAVTGSIAWQEDEINISGQLLKISCRRWWPVWSLQHNPRKCKCTLAICAYLDRSIDGRLQHSKECGSVVLLFGIGGALHFRNCATRAPIGRASQGEPFLSASASELQRCYSTDK